MTHAPAPAPANWDHIIVGGGSAGCLLAWRLSADPQRRVLLIEAGGKDDYLWIHIPAGYLRCIGNPRTDWCWRTAAQAGLAGRALRYPRGKVLGGSSSINGMIYMRGQAADYDGWAALLGDDAWRWDACLPHFMAHEAHWRGASPHHGASGPLRVERQRLAWPVLEAVARAMQQAGIPASADFNTGDNEGVGYFEVNQHGGLRLSAAKAFLRPASRRPNLEIWTGALADRLLFDDAAGPLRAVGVRVLPQGGGEPIEARCHGEVVLAAGSIATPLLLQRSGIGPAALLHAHGVAPRLDAPGVGANLHDHLQLRSSYRVSGARTLNTLAASWHGRLRIGADYLLRRRGPLAMAPSQLGAFTRALPDAATPDVEYHVQPLSLDAFGEPLHRDDAITAAAVPLRPTSRGSVQLGGPSADAPPRIDPNYLAAEADRRTAAAALRLTRRIMAMPALAAHAPQEIKPGAACNSQAELEAAAAAIGTTIFHPVGTCAMGPDGDAQAVLDARLRVRGVANLRVADASAMPRITSGNTNAPTQTE